ncbi:four helix bundle protein [Zhouia sp. PK063]|uniref:four helix bundle protein n=1 Tax=Zhouia sp. PK063 TaxID=3373602 RepID=UPI0037A70579
MKSENLIADKSFQFSLSIIELFKQLLRSATSIGANIEEAIAAQTKKDFIHKMSIASKEARETKYWLRLLNESEITSISVNKPLVEIEHIINIVTKIVKTSQEKI